MIRQLKPVTLQGASKILEKADKENPRVKKTVDYIKKFVKKAKSEEAVKKLETLGISKLDERHIIKIADFMPQDASELRLILTADDISLDENETEKILATIHEIK